MREGFRFDPARFEVDAETAWVFSRAFGPTEQDFSGRVDGGRSLEMAEKFALAARIGARVPLGVLVDEVGEEPAEEFSLAYRQAAALAVAQEGLCRQLAEVGVELGTSTIFLKGAGLRLAGFTNPGSRESCDVDVLIPMADAVRYQQALLNRGYREQDGVASEHQLLPVHHPSGLMIEVHTLIKGVRISSITDSATGEDLVDSGLYMAVPDQSVGVCVPSTEVLACHVFVHGVAQHGLSPAAYPISRLLADVQDLSRSERAWDWLGEEAFDWISHDVSREEARAVVDLVDRLGAGENPREIATGNDNEARLLRHAVAGTIDEGYRQALKLRHYSDPLAGSDKKSTFLRNSFHAVFLNDAQVEGIYGKPSSPIAYLGWKLWRPFDLVIRAGRYGGAWVRHRLRK